MEEVSEFDFLDEEEEEKQYLDLGYIKNRWYYGLKTVNGLTFLVYSDKTIERDSHECPTCQEHFKNTIKSPMVCSCGRKGKMNRVFPKGFKADGYIGDIAPTWAKDWVKQYLEEKLNLDKKKMIDKKQLFKEIKDTILYFMDFGDKEYYADIQACWVMATYCYPLFYWFPHLLFKAPKSSGKTKNARILMQLSFRGYDLGTSAGCTPAQIFRTLEGNRGTIFIDEFEQHNYKLNESQTLINQMLNAGVERDTYIIRNIPLGKNDWIQKKFPIFCPKIICNISGLNDVTFSRCIVFELMKYSDTTKGQRKPGRPEEKEKLEFISNRMYPLIMEEWRNIRTIEKNLELDLSGRDEDNWRPILTMAKWIGEDVFDRIKEHIGEFQEIQSEQNDEDLQMFQAIYANMVNGEAKATPKDIAGWMDVSEKELSYHTRKIGWRLKKYNFKRERTSKGRYYRFTKKQVENITLRYFNTKCDVDGVNDDSSFPREEAIK